MKSRERRGQRGQIISILMLLILSEKMTEAEYEKILSTEIKSEIMRKIDNEADGDRDKMSRY